MHEPSIKMPAVSPVAARLKEARVAAGLSTHAAAALVAKRFPGLRLSHMSIARYEKGEASPGIDVLGALAMIYDRPIAWLLEPGQPLTGVRYRLLSSKTGIKLRHQFECQSQYWLEAYHRLEHRVGQPLRAKPLKFDADTPAEEAAMEVRRKMGLKERDAVVSVIDILEAFGIRTMEMPTDLNIDGFAARLGSEPVVILKPNAANDRCRMNAGHELRHVLFGDIDLADSDDRELDNKAFEFASFLLLPRKLLHEAFKGQSAVQLVMFKERFGISMAAMIFRAEKVGIISQSTAKRLWIQFSRRGWRAKEPGKVRADRAVRFERLLDQAISEKKMSWAEAATVTGVKAEDLRRRRDLAMGITEDEGGEEGGAVLRLME
jgi:Zn-dependent peptidase ImmA (M78 family)/transcriptional regulator with XRE-family HTH domain